MLRNRALRIQMVKTNKTGAEETEINNLDLEHINEVAKDFVVHTATAIVCVIGAVIGMKTASQVLVNVTNPANWR